MSILVLMAMVVVACGEPSGTASKATSSTVLTVDSTVAPTVLPNTTSITQSIVAATNEPAVEEDAAADPIGGVRSPSDTTDEELAAALVETIMVDVYGPGTADCVAQGIVERLGGDELRALGWTPEVMRAPGFSPFIELKPEQLYVLDAALADCVDATDLALQSLGVSADEVDLTCLDAALGSDPAQTVLKSFPTSADYDAGLGMASAALECMDPVDLISSRWSSVAPRYSIEGGQEGAEINAVDRECIVGWLGDDQRATALTVFELTQSFRWIDDPVSLVDQLDRLNELQTTGELTRSRLDNLNGCFAS